jgi:hypothetical protein
MSKTIPHHLKPIFEAVGPCPVCGNPKPWLNDIPLRAFCWGDDHNEHDEWSRIVPNPVQPYQTEEIPENTVWEKTK